MDKGGLVIAKRQFCHAFLMVGSLPLVVFTGIQISIRQPKESAPYRVVSFQVKNKFYDEYFYIRTPLCRGY